MTEMLILFIVCTVVNVVLSTVKSIVTVKGSALAASLMNAITYGFYTYVIILTNIEGVSTVAKMVITALCNFIGVYVVKFIEEKARKEKIWRVEATVDKKEQDHLVNVLKNSNIPFNYIENVGKWVIFNIYCATCAESSAVKEILKKFDAKYFVSENKGL